MRGSGRKTSDFSGHRALWAKAGISPRVQLGKRQGEKRSSPRISVEQMSWDSEKGQPLTFRPVWRQAVWEHSLAGLRDCRKVWSAQGAMVTGQGVGLSELLKGEETLPQACPGPVTSWDSASLAGKGA